MSGDHNMNQKDMVFNTISSLRHKKTVGPIESAMTGLSQTVMQPCAGRNCGSTNPNLHSAECFEDYEQRTKGNDSWRDREGDRA